MAWKSSSKPGALLAGAFLILCFHAALSTPVQGAAVVDGGYSLDFFVIGDWGRAGSEDQKRVARQMNRRAENIDVDFIVSTGDNFYQRGVESVEDSLWVSAFEQVYSLPALEGIPWYVTLGNHDYMGDIRAQLEYGDVNREWILPATYYSRDFAIEGRTVLRILFLDTNPFIPEYRSRPHRYRRIEEQDSGEQLRWMRKTLGDEFVDLYSAVKHTENDEFQAIVTPWEREILMFNV